MSLSLSLAVCSLGFGSALSADATADYEWALPAGFPVPVVPANNPMSAAKVELGRRLFSDTRLSVTGGQSCAGCHSPLRAFTEDRRRSVGALGDTLPFNAPTLWNSAYSTGLSWVEKGARNLEQQHLGPLTSQNPVELGTGPRQLAVLWADAELREQILAAYPDAQRLDLSMTAGALASFVRTLIRGSAAFDGWLFEDDASALTSKELAGLELFVSKRLNCTACHRGFLLSGPTRSVRGEFPPSFYITGVGTEGLAVRAPSLRFIKETAPYMHDGSLPTLDAVIAFYESGAGSNAGPQAKQRMRPFTLNMAERAALLAFLEAL